MRVLVCDDEPDIRDLFRSAFELEGAMVVEAVDGQDCIDAVTRQLPDLIVLDLYMPRRDGLSALKELHETWPDVPVVVVSAHANVEVMATGRRLGARQCFQKPTFLASVSALVAKYSDAA